MAPTVWTHVHLVYSLMQATVMQEPGIPPVFHRGSCVAGIMAGLMLARYPTAIAYLNGLVDAEYPVPEEHLHAVEAWIRDNVPEPTTPSNSSD